LQQMRKNRAAEESRYTQEGYRLWFGENRYAKSSG
jgi:hypothetical protein